MFLFFSFSVVLTESFFSEKLKLNLYPVKKNSFSNVCWTDLNLLKRTQRFKVLDSLFTPSGESCVTVFVSPHYIFLVVDWRILWCSAALHHLILPFLPYWGFFFLEVLKYAHRSVRFVTFYTISCNFSKMTLLSVQREREKAWLESQLSLYCVEFACSPFACVGFLPKELHHRLIDQLSEWVWDWMTLQQTGNLSRVYHRS